MEERLVGKSEAEREKDEEYIKNKKLLKLVERYKRELNETRMECNDLKARLLDGAEMRVTISLILQYSIVVESVILISILKLCLTWMAK